MDKTNYKAIGKRIRYIRMEKGLTQERAAEMADISTNYISQIERGNAQFSLGVLIKLSDALNVSTDYLLVDVIRRKQHASDYIMHCEELADTQIEFIEQMIGITKQYHMIK